MATMKTLNEEQRRAIQHGDGPLLIIAGAGTGKTTVITERIKHLIVEKKIQPNNILALTFTEKAAREMEERVDIAIPYGYTQMWISTFHAFCDRILRAEAIHIGLNPGYMLTTEAEAVMFLRKNLFQLNLDYFRPLGNPNKFLEGLLQHFSRLKDEDITPEQYLDFAKKRNAKSLTEAEAEEIKKTLELANAYKTYDDLKVKEGSMDFSDLIANTLKLFRTRKNILNEYQEQFQYILIDEFQDTNFAQNELALFLAGEKKNITAVGDDDQSIFRFRGSSLSNMLQFRDHFPNATVVMLNKNYRSTAQILDHAYQLIQQNNPDRLEVREKIDKKLKPMRITQGSPVDTILTDRVENEAEEVAKKIQELHASKKKYSYKDFAILVRANDHAQPFLRTFERYRIPYQFLGPGQLFHQEEIKDLIAYLKVLYNFEDSVSLYRVLTMQIFGLSATEIAILLHAAKKKNRTLFETLSQTDEIALSEITRKKLQDFVAMVKRHLGKIPKETAGQILYYFLQDSHLLEQYLEAKTQRDEIKVQNVAKFFERLKSYEAERSDASVFAVVDWIDLSMQMGESPLAANTDWSENEAVNILTVHSSKGLEFPVVFLVNLVTQRFPSRERREQIPLSDALIKEILPEGDFHLQEERRLFYVGMTRAKDRLFLTAANFYGEGKRERKYSPFLIEAMGAETVEKAKEKKRTEKQQLSLLDLFPQENDSPNPKVQTPAPHPITYISYSQLQTFEICPLHYKLRYMLKIPTAPNASLTFGTSMHAALKDFYQKKIRKEAVDITDIEQILRVNWINEGYVSKFHEQKSFVEGVAILTDYLKNHFDPHNLPIATELPFQFFIKNEMGQLLKVGGRIDRIDKVDKKIIEILDYKTGTNLPDEKELAKNFQLSLYALAATEIRDPLYHRNTEEIKLSLYYLEEGKKLTTTRSKEQLEEAKKEILRRVETISKSEFLCSGNSLCLNCEYKMLCRTG